MNALNDFHLGDCWLAHYKYLHIVWKELWNLNAEPNYYSWRKQYGRMHMHIHNENGRANIKLSSVWLTGRCATFSLQSI